ncbi:MAG: glycoside hydrolase family 9 protein [bacterium]
MKGCTIKFYFVVLFLSVLTSAEAGDQEISSKIFVNQMGYLPSAVKVAYVSSVVGLPFQLCTQENGKPLFRGMLKLAEAGDGASGANLWEADFSQVQKPGEYYLDVPGIGRSYTFRIEENLYQEVAITSLRVFQSLRCDPSKYKAPTQKWGAVHIENVTDATGTANAPIQQVTGGWCDGSDLGRYTVNGVTAAGLLLTLYEFIPYAYEDGVLHIPESGNGVSDLLDEVRWELEWLMRMQDESGGIYHKLTPVEPNLETPADQLQGIHYLFPPSTAATAGGCALLARASRLYTPVDATFAAECLSAAFSAWKFVEQHPNDGGFQNPAQVQTKAYTDPDDTDERFWAALELYLTTQEPSFLRIAESIAERRIPLLSASGYWGNVMPLAAAVTISSVTQVTQSELFQELRQDVLSLADSIMSKIRQDGLLLSIREGEFTWGSNSAILQNAFILLLASRISNQADYREGALQQIHYILGRNPVSICYVTGFGDRSPKNIYNPVLVSDAQGKVISGLLAGGANQFLNDSVLKSNFTDEYPPSMMYKDDAASFSSNEFSLSWNAVLAFVTAFLSY